LPEGPAAVEVLIEERYTGLFYLISPTEGFEMLRFLWFRRLEQHHIEHQRRKTYLKLI